MNKYERTSLLASLTSKLREAGSWCGETHLQKALYLLQEGLGVPTAFRYILYHHGPYSFELTDALGAARADGVLSLEAQSPPYGPKYSSTDFGERMVQLHRGAVVAHQSQIDRTVQLLGASGVLRLEQLATALWVKRNHPELSSETERARKLHELKPHISIPEAEAATREIDAFVG